MDRFSYCTLAAALRRLVSTTLANLVTYAVAAALASPAALADEAALKAEIAELRAQVEQMKAQIKDLAAVSRPAPAPSPAVAASAAAPSRAPAQTAQGELAARVEKLEQSVSAQAEEQSATTLFG